jgi:hypothetical protein
MSPARERGKIDESQGFVVSSPEELSGQTAFAALKNEREIPAR